MVNIKQLAPFVKIPCDPRATLCSAGSDVVHVKKLRTFRLFNMPARPSAKIGQPPAGIVPVESVSRWLLELSHDFCSVNKVAGSIPAGSAARSQLVQG